MEMGDGDGGELDGVDVYADAKMDGSTDAKDGWMGYVEAGVVILWGGGGNSGGRE